MTHDMALNIIERANQRDGRMLSVVDLVQRGTLTTAQAAWAVARVEAGSGWLVGARPGGAGKTAVMCALMGFLPAGETVRLTLPWTGWEQSRPGECVVSYEIGAGEFEAYAWGDDVRRMTALGAAGCRIVSNLHADTLEQARQQIVLECGAPEEHFAAFGMFLGIAVSRVGYEAKRVVGSIDYREDGAWRRFDETAHSPTAREKVIAGFIDECLAAGVLLVEQVRGKWLERPR